MNKATTKKVAAKKPATAPKKAAQKTKPAAKKQAARKMPSDAKVELAKPSKTVKKAAAKDRKIAALRKKGALPPLNPKAGQLGGKAPKPSKRAQATQAAVEQAITTPAAPVAQEALQAQPIVPAKLAMRANPYAVPNILPKAPKDQPYVAVTHSRQTCIVLSRGARARFIPFASNGLYILSQECAALDLEYQPTDYPVARAAKMYYDAVKVFPCAENAREVLAQLAGILPPTALPAQEVPNDLTITKEIHMSKNETPAAKKTAASKVATLDKSTPKTAAKKAPAKKESSAARISSFAGKSIKALVTAKELGVRAGSKTEALLKAIIGCTSVDKALEKTIIWEGEPRQINSGDLAYFVKSGKIKIA